MPETVTPTAIREAYDRLVEIAERGNPFRWDEVYQTTVFTTEEQAQQIIGTGYDFARVIAVEDVGADGTTNTVEGAVQFRVIAKKDETGARSLFLRTRLTWNRHTGVEHSSYARYDISPEALQTLMAKAENPAPAKEQELPDPATMTDEEALEIMAEFAFDLADAERKALSYDAQWVQTPTMDELLTEAMASEEPTPLDELPHVKAVDSAQKAEPQLLCMLSPLDFGEVLLDELPKLCEWVSTQPEIAVPA